MSLELSCFKNKNRCSNLQMIRKQSKVGKEWETGVKELNQEPESFKLNTSDKLPDCQTCPVTRVSQRKWQVCPLLL